MSESTRGREPGVHSMPSTTRGLEESLDACVGVAILGRYD
jgi:hypothetical protein